MNWVIGIITILLFSCASEPSLRDRHYGGRDTIRNKHETSIPIESGRTTGKVIVGEASFYAEKYHGRTTANGETFDMNALTCAHKSWPFNTMLKVTYSVTGKSVVVRVNDRGPYVGNRIIDLSKEAARRIGLINEGVGIVQIEILSWGNK